MSTLKTPKIPTTEVRVNLPVDVMNAVTACAERAGITRTDFIARALSVAVALDGYDEVSITGTRGAERWHLLFPWLTRRRRLPRHREPV